MAVKNLESLVLPGVPAFRGVVTGLQGIDSNPVNCRMPAMVLSHPRHPSQRDPQAGLDAGPRYGRARAAGAAVRAGRPVSWAGVTVRRSPARAAGQAVLSGWPFARGSTRPAFAWRTGRTTTVTRANAGEELPERCPGFSVQELAPVGYPSRPPASTPDQSRKPGTACLRPLSTGRSRLRREDT
jgi:hypothetical protein